MNTENMIDITGVDLKELAKAAYDLSRPQGMGFLHFEEGALTDEEAASLIQEGSRGDRFPLDMDYVKGRACKLHVIKEGDKLYINDRWYDHSENDLIELLDRIGVSTDAGAIERMFLCTRPDIADEIFKHRK